MDNEQKVIVACPKCGQKLKCAAGGIGTCPKCGERITFSVKKSESITPQNSGSPIFSHNENVRRIFKCPHCGHTQYRQSELCEKCGKQMRQVAELTTGYWVWLCVSLFFCIGGLHTGSEGSLTVGVIGIILFVLAACIQKSRNGKFITYNENTPITALPYLKFSDCKGIPEFEEGHSGWIRLDERRRCFIIKDDLDNYERLLPFSQINEFELKVRYIEKDKSVIGRSVAGYLIAGPVGSVVGAVSGVGKKKESQQYLEISYYPKGSRSMEKTAQFYIASCSTDFYKDSQEALGIAPAKPNFSTEKHGYL